MTIKLFSFYQLPLIDQPHYALKKYLFILTHQIVKNFGKNLINVEWSNNITLIYTC